MAEGEVKRTSRWAGAFLLFVLLTPGATVNYSGTASDDRGPGGTSAALAVAVSETSDAILLRIQLSGDVEPESLEVQFSACTAVVFARDGEGGQIRSQPLRLSEPVLEEGSSAGYDADGALVITLPKLAVDHAPSPGDPETR